MEPRLRAHLDVLLVGEDPAGPVAHARRSLESMGFDVQWRDDIGALLAERGAGGAVWSGHLDVVPAGEGWTRPPHQPTFEGDRVYGRGSADMRGAVAAALDAVADTDAPARFVLTTDEETTMHAARALARGGWIEDAPLVVVGEPTDLKLGVAGKGVAWMEARVTGRSTHASTPDAGESAAAKLVQGLAKMDTGPYGPDHPRLGRATIALTGLASGDRFNVLPASAVARFDSRFPPPLSPQDAVDRVTKHMPDAQIHLDKEEPSFEALDGSARLVTAALGPLAPEVVGVPYASEAGHWGPLVPTVLLGPGSIRDAHGPDESVSLDDLVLAAELYRRVFEHVGGRPVSP